MATITLEGKLYEGQKLEIRIDGEPVNVESPEALVIKVEGDLADLATSQSVTMDGNVHGDVKAGNSVSCGNVGGDITAGNKLTCEDVSGDVRAGHDVTCGTVGNGVHAGRDVHCGHVTGDVRAGHAANTAQA
jgi:hypothetical protein